MKPERMSHSRGGFNRSRRGFDDSPRHIGHREYRRYSDEDFESRGRGERGFNREYSREREGNYSRRERFDRREDTEGYRERRIARPHRVYRTEPYGKLTAEQIRQSNEERRKLRAERDEIDSTPNYHYDFVKKQMEEAQNQEDWSPGMGFHSPENVEESEPKDELAQEYAELAPSEVEEKLLERMEALNAPAESVQKESESTEENAKSADVPEPEIQFPEEKVVSEKEEKPMDFEESEEDIHSEDVNNFDEDDFSPENGSDDEWEAPRGRKSFFDDFNEDDDDDFADRSVRRHYQGKGERKTGYGKKSYGDVRLSHSDRRDGRRSFSRSQFRDRNRDRFESRGERRFERESEGFDSEFRKYGNDRGFHKEHRRDSFEDCPRRTSFGNEDSYSYEHRERKSFQKSRGHDDNRRRDERPSKGKFFERFEGRKHSGKKFGHGGRKKSFRCGNF